MMHNIRKIYVIIARRKGQNNSGIQSKFKLHPKEQGDKYTCHTSFSSDNKHIR